MLSTTVREGIESVLFLTSVSASTGAASIPIPGIVGVFLGVLTGMALFYRRAPGPCVLGCPDKLRSSRDRGEAFAGSFKSYGSLTLRRFGI